MTLSRRSFVTSAAAAVVAPTVLVKRASAVAAADKLALGFIGVGTMGGGHLGGFLGRQEVEVVAVCDVVEVRLDSAKAVTDKRYADRTKGGTYAGSKEYDHFHQLLAQQGLA